jgi:F-type H+-transporting ATPase subunit epsilon
MVSDDLNKKSNNGIKLDIVTTEQVVFSGLVNYIAVPGIDGELGILPHHSALITMLKPGELKIRRENEEICVAVGGGFVDISPERVIVLADIAERDDDIDMQKAEEAIHRARQVLLDRQTSAGDRATIEASLRLEITRLNIAEKRKKKKKKIN